MANKWKTLGSKIIHKNPWFTLREDDVIRPDGNKGKYYVIDSNSAAIIAEDKDGKIYLVGQTRYAIGNVYSWEIVMGGHKSGASALAAAKRELKEETGLLAKKWINLGYVYPFNGFSSEKIVLYVAKDLKKTEQLLGPTEDITIRKEGVSRIVKMIRNNEITCGTTTAAIYKYLLYKEKNHELPKGK